MSPETTSRPQDARIAIYDAAGAPPRVEDVASEDIGEYISLLATRTYEISRAMGGRVPFSVISEVVENFIHAEFCAPVVTILDGGNTIRFSDQGPGFRDRARALEPGYTTATRQMRCYIRGVGSGLPLARECLSFSGGAITIEDNLGSGAVVTVSMDSPESDALAHTCPEWVPVPRSDDPSLRVPSPDDRRQDGFRLEPSSYPTPSGPYRLTNRQKRVLALVMEAGAAGPSLVARELAIGLSTAYRDLAHLQSLGMIESDDSGKRAITPAGSLFLENLLSSER